MPPMPPPPPTSSSRPPAAGGVSGTEKNNPEIVVIPEKFYGVALKLQTQTDAERAKQSEPTPPPPPPPPKPVVQPPAALPSHSILPIVAVVLFLILLVGGGFVYFNRALLFQKPAVVPPTPPAPVIVAPSAPANLTVVVTGLSVGLSWVDTAGNEFSYRLERKEGQGTFLPLTTLPANSTAFLDVSVQSGTSYAYRLVASNDGGESLPSNEASVVTPVAVLPPPPGPTLPPAGLDSDSDGLTDVEEALYRTDPRDPDSDGDSFLDGNEVFHLYNPIATSSIRLLDSGVVVNLSAPAGWSLYLPSRWTSRLETPDGSRATIDSGHGETFVIRIEDNPQRLSLLDWYLSQHPGVLSSDVKHITTKGGLEGVVGSEHLDAYFVWGEKIFSIRYDLDGQTFINFRTTFEMMLNSLKLPGAPMVTAPPEATTGPGTFVETTTSTVPTSSVVSPSATSTERASTTTVPLPFASTTTRP